MWRWLIVWKFDFLDCEARDMRSAATCAADGGSWLIAGRRAYCRLLWRYCCLSSKWAIFSYEWGRDSSIPQLLINHQPIIISDPERGGDSFSGQLGGRTEKVSTIRMIKWPNESPVQGISARSESQSPAAFIMLVFPHRRTSKTARVFILWSIICYLCARLSLVS